MTFNQKGPMDLEKQITISNIFFKAVKIGALISPCKQNLMSIIEIRDIENNLDVNLV